MKTVSKPATVIGMYLTDSSDLYNGNKLCMPSKHHKYIPIVGLVKINSAAELTLTDGNNISNEIVSYDRCTSGKSLSPETVRSKRIDITHNDLYMGPIRIVLNLSNKDISVSDEREFRKTFNKIKQDKLEEFAGKVIIYNIYTLNTPQHILDLTGNGDYFTTIINQLENKNNPKIKEMLTVYSYARDNWHMFNRNINGLIANSIKVVTLTIIDETELRDNDIFISELDWLISTKDINNLPLNPAGIIGNTAIKDIQHIFPENSFMCYIVDNEDRIGDRYINVAGHVKRISKVKNKSMPNGLYFADKGSSDPAGEMFLKLEDIDNGEFVYKSIEEANDGANVRKQYMDEIERAKAQLENSKVENSAEVIRLKTEHEREISKLKADAARLAANFDLEKANMERELLERKRALEETKGNNEIERDTYKTRTDVYKYDMDMASMRNKHYYETERYHRDSTLETLKTAAAVLGVASTVILVWSKLKN